MQLTHFFIVVLLLTSSFISHANESVERLFWDKVPLRITLPVGKERLVTFPAVVRLGIPGKLSAKLRSQSNQGTVYWLANEAFDTQRIEVREVNSQEIYLIDLKATKQAQSVSPIEVIVKQDSKAQKQDSKIARKNRKIGYAALTRFAAQQLYAPARLLKPLFGIYRVSVSRQTTTYLVKGEMIKATPLASWQSGSFYVTAIELVNTSKQFIMLDPRKIRGEWRTATFQHSRLHPTGSEADSTTLYLISDRPFHEKMI